MPVSPGHYQFAFYSWILFVATVVSLVTTVFAWQRRRSSGAKFIVLLELALAQWSFCAGFEVAATTTSLKILWSQLAYVGTTLGPVFFFAFVVSHCGFNRYLTPRNMAIVLAMPVLTTVAASTNKFHAWLWTTVAIIDETNIAVYGHGPWFWAFAVYTYVLITVAVVLLTRHVARAQPFYRKQAGLVLLGTAFPVSANLVYIFEINPLPGMDWTPVAFAISGLVLFVSVSRLGLVSIVPLAREKLIDTMQDGIIVFDDRNRIVDINASMQMLLRMAHDKIVGQQASAALKGWQSLAECVENNRGTCQEISPASPSAPHYFEAQLTPLLDKERRYVGKLLLLRDITNRKEAELEREELIAELQNRLDQVRSLSGLLPICSNCKKIRGDGGYWENVEKYVKEHAKVEFSHSLCPDCIREIYSAQLPEELIR